MTDFAPSLADYPFSMTIETRALDCDTLGHISNVVFYSFFDTAVNHFLARQCDLDVAHDNIVPFVSGSQCQYISHATYPETIAVGMRVLKTGAQFCHLRIIGICRRNPAPGGPRAVCSCVC